MRESRNQQGKVPSQSPLPLFAWTYARTAQKFIIDAREEIQLAQQPDRVYLSHYRRGDVFQDIESCEAEEAASAERIECDVGLATAAARFRMTPTEPMELTIDIPQTSSRTGSLEVRHLPASDMPSNPWKSSIAAACQLQSPDPKFNYVFDAAIRSLLLHTSVDVYPGPYCFVREEADRLILCSGLPNRWLETSETIRFGPTSTPYGPITV